MRNYNMDLYHYCNLSMCRHFGMDSESMELFVIRIKFKIFTFIFWRKKKITRFAISARIAIYAGAFKIGRTLNCISACAIILARYCRAWGFIKILKKRKGKKMFRQWHIFFYNFMYVFDKFAHYSHFHMSMNNMGSCYYCYCYMYHHFDMS